MDTKNDLSIFSQSMFVRFLGYGLLKSTVYSFLAFCGEFFFVQTKHKRRKIKPQN